MLARAHQRAVTLVLCLRPSVTAEEMNRRSFPSIHQLERSLGWLGRLEKPGLG